MKWRKNSRLKKTLPFTILLGVLVIFFWQPIVVIYHQQRAGKILQTVTNNIEFSDMLSYRCFLGQLTENPSEQIEVAINYLLKAYRYEAQKAHTAYMLGQAFCLNHEYKLAIEYLEESQTLRENNPNLFIESGFASMALVNENTDSITIEYFKSANSIYSKSIKDYFEGSVNFEQLIAVADNCFRVGYLEAAYNLYKNLSFIQPLSDIEEYRLYLSAMITEPPDGFITRNFNMPNLSIKDYLLILPENMFVLNQAKNNPISLIGGKPFAVIYSEKSDAITLVNFSGGGDYIFEFSLLDHLPSPTILQFSIDFQQVAEMKLTSGDGRLAKRSIRSPVSAGVHSLSIKLLNDMFESGLDRNGYIAEIEIKKLDN